ncbi:leader peptidase (prepilin peptidase)/N-methyltransferase [Asanoa ferruginea]|uniref:Leader peptidase (Prepilin peptidase)/N-methyltransferase n=1 Tax=Asanoa ferruginea TaxID=53367 RepID=A0A3D9ZFH8_9ACTN|nr:A24 family peptidase [Asanoa ferruginea]REF96025.1 leader peptidase (prepilin peptidase)/N-methyltransferase [Asanoa ferruginea]GIF48114.1 prepilin peptidase [Asanoa ferruginea]
MTTGVRVRTAPRRLPAVLVTPLLRWLAINHTVAPGEPWRRTCPGCGAAIGFGGALLPQARCGGCAARVGPPPWSVEVLALLALLALVAFAGGRPVVSLPVVAAFAWWAALAIPLVLVDLAVHRLPDRLTLPAAAGVAVLLGAAALVDGAADRWVRSLLAGAGVALFFATTTLVLGRRGFGLGDAKLALSCAALLGWFGWGAVLLGLMAGLLLSALVSIVLLLAGKVRWTSSLPFGPFLVAGTVLGLFVVVPLS